MLACVAIRTKLMKISQLNNNVEYFRLYFEDYSFIMYF